MGRVLAVGLFVASGCSANGAAPTAVLQAAPSPTAGGSTTSAASFTLLIPLPAASASAHTRSPLYISGATDTVIVSLLAASSGLPTPNVPQSIAVAPGSAPCDGPMTANYYSCTITTSLPIGSDQVQIQAAQGATVISQQRATVQLRAGIANSAATDPAFSMTLDAYPGAPSPIPNFGEGTGGFNFTFPENCSTGQINVLENDVTGSFIDAAVGGIPSLTLVSSNSAVVSTVLIPGSGAVAQYGVTTGASGSATITVTESPAGASDGIPISANQSTLLNITLTNSGAVTCPTS